MAFDFTPRATPPHRVGTLPVFVSSRWCSSLPPSGPASSPWATAPPCAASEVEIKALSFNYAAMLKEKEEQLGKLREENGSLKRSLESCKAVSANSN
uniref:Uncharacterized protein n=1 Tax=Zea mays TaxID=4577 RepID=A0A804PMY4_MAIZE